MNRHRPRIEERSGGSGKRENASAGCAGRTVVRKLRLFFKPAAVFDGKWKWKPVETREEEERRGRPRTLKVRGPRRFRKHTSISRYRHRYMCARRRARNTRRRRAGASCPRVLRFSFLPSADIIGNDCSDRMNGRVKSIQRSSVCVGQRPVVSRAR